MKSLYIISLISLSIILSACSQEDRTFAGQFMSNPAAVGAIAPSGEELSEMMTETIDPENSIVIELGAGTGPFTDKLVTKISKENLFIIENNEAFYEHLVKRFPGYNILGIDARELDKHIPAHLHGKINVVVSGLPFRSLPHDVAIDILRSLKKVCAPNFKLIQFTYFNEPPLPVDEAALLGVTPTYHKESKKNTPSAHVWIYNTAAAPTK
jgi:phosphatidylethanolamine/phosphatidyl-N-methylethanolamine N-methyltransferase